MEIIIDRRPNNEEFFFQVFFSNDIADENKNI